MYLQKLPCFVTQKVVCNLESYKSKHVQCRNTLSNGGKAYQCTSRLRGYNYTGNRKTSHLSYSRATVVNGCGVIDVSAYVTVLFQKCLKMSF